MNKLKRPTLATTKNCIMLLKEALNDCRHSYNAQVQTSTTADGTVYIEHAIENIQIMLTMLTDNESWMGK